MRYVFGFLWVWALGVTPLVGCSDESTAAGGGSGSGDTGGDAGAGGDSGTGGADSPCEVAPPASCVSEVCDDGDPCTNDVCTLSEDRTVLSCLSEPVDCDDKNDCTVDGLCDLADGGCSTPTPVADGTSCAGGTCESGACSLFGSALPCTEQGLVNAIAAGGGPYTFDCDGPTTLVTEREIVIHNDVILDGGGDLIVDGNEDHRVFFVPEGVTAELHDLTVTQGKVVWPDQGGDICNLGELTLANCVVEKGTAERGGGICNRVVCSSVGGGIANHGQLTLVSSIVSDNTGVFGDGTGIYNSSAGEVELTRSTVSRNADEGIANGGVLTITDTSIVQNSGDGVYNVGIMTLSNSTVSANEWGIFNTSEGRLVVTNSIVSDNLMGGMLDAGSATTLTSSIVSENQGGGISYQGLALTITDSTISANEGSGVNAHGVLTVTNSTISNNVGSGIGTACDEAMIVRHSTLSGNGAAISVPVCDATLQITATLLDGPCVVHERGSLTVASNGYNIESDGNTCGFDQGTDQVDVSADDLKLEPLQDNGGPTMTHALLPGSVAIDVIPEVDCVDADGAPLTNDQRGEPRPGGAMCDVGAFEVQEGSL